MPNKSIKIISKPIKKSELEMYLQNRFPDFIKAVVDIHQGIMAINAELHADEEQELLELGSQQSDLRGINLYPNDYPNDNWIEFDSMINIRPSQNNRSRTVQDPKTQEKIREIVNLLITK